MAAQNPVSGEWARQNLQGYTGANVWGTGIHPVHSHYGSEALRTAPVTLREGESVPPHQAIPDALVGKELWGYTVEDSNYTGVEYDGRPRWGDDAPEHRGSGTQQPPVGSSGALVNTFRAMADGAHRVFRSRSPYNGSIQYQIPSETVSEGWLNKPHGTPGDAVPSDIQQLERQTSMQQRYQTRVNEAAVIRNTDVPRTGINSLVTGQKVKEYSGGERHYDMLPKEQDVIPRPFWYRTAGTGEPADMIPNTMYTIQPIERVPPAEPSIGQPETTFVGEYGYTDEDQFYA